METALSLLGAMRHRSLFDHGKRVAGWVLSGLVVVGCYGLGKLAGPTHTLPLTQIDRWIPFLPWTVWIYGSGTKAALLAWLMVPDSRAGRQLLLTLTVCSVVCLFCFATFPTTYPRELHPLPVGDSATLRELASLRRADSPSNCLPSLHVALAFGLALSWTGFLRRAGGWARRWAGLPLVWAALVSLCTLTTKQHYLVDVPAGAAVGVGAWGLAAWWGRRKAAPLRLRLLDPRPAAALLTRVRAHQWRLDDLPLPPTDPLPAPLGRLLNEVIYIEEIARLNFELLRDASDTPELRELYQLFADEERRHADGLRRILARAGEPLRGPGLGNALVLDQFDSLHPDRDGPLVAMSTPVFETFLDAGTIPFLQAHPALKGPALDHLVEKISADETAHLALNWMVSREVAKSGGGLGLLANPQIYRGMLAVPWMSLEVYSLAHRLGYDFATLLPPFYRLWRLHERIPELRTYPLWWPYRLFVIAGVVATQVCLGLIRFGRLYIDLWVAVTRGTTLVASALFGSGLLARRGLPRVG